MSSSKKSWWRRLLELRKRRRKHSDQLRRKCLLESLDPRVLLAIDVVQPLGERQAKEDVAPLVLDLRKVFASDQDEALTYSLVSNSNSSLVHAFGSKTSPRPPRLDTDLGVSSPVDVIPAQSPPLPRGASTFGDPLKAPLSGQYHRLPKGTPLPEGIDVIPDGIDVLPNSPHPPTHHTVFPSEDMSAAEFTEKFRSLPWTAL